MCLRNGELRLVKVVKNRENLGFAEGTNTGIKQDKGEYILTLNDDTRIDNQFLI